MHVTNRVLQPTSGRSTSREEGQVVHNKIALTKNLPEAETERAIRDFVVLGEP
jgi:hypothetical protein